MVDVLGLKPQDYWDDSRSKEYNSKKNIKKTQEEMTLKAVELLGLADGLVLDVGCGSGFSSKVISDSGLKVFGLDISLPMCKISKKNGFSVVNASFERMPFKGDVFDGLISVSALQWVSGGYEDFLESYHSVSNEFFRVLKSGGVAVLQFYSGTPKEFELVKKIFKKKFFVEEVSAWQGRKAKVFLRLKKKK